MLEWQLVRGVNLLCPHLEGYSLRGIRKRDYPATLFYQQPWWGEYKTLNDYFSRIGMLLSEGEIHFRTLVLHPMASAWLCFNNGDNGRLRELDEKLASLLTALDEAQIPYHLGDERILARHGSISGKHFQVGQQTYDVVLVPDALVLSEETVSLLEKYSENGGLVILRERCRVMWTVNRPAESPGLPRGAWCAQAMLPLSPLFRVRRTHCGFRAGTFRRGIHHPPVCR